jgi:hypothetical protein
MIPKAGLGGQTGGLAGQPVGELREVSSATFSWIDLKLGSLLVCQDLVWTGGRDPVRCRLAQSSAQPLSIPLGTVRAFRFRPLSQDLAAEWDKIVHRQSKTDRLVIPFEKGLDYYSGLLRAVAPEGVEFQVDQDLVSLPLARVAGIVLGGPEMPVSGTGTCVLKHRGGSRLSAREVRCDEGEVFFTLVEGVEGRLPLQEIREFDFVAGRRVLLTDLPIVAKSYQPPVPLPGMEPLLAELLLPGSFPSQGEAENRIDRQAVLIPAGSEIAWNLPADASRLVGSLRAVAVGSFSAELRVRVKQSDRVVAEYSFLPGQEREMAVPLSGPGPLALEVRAVSAPGLGVGLELRGAAIVLAPR